MEIETKTSGHGVKSHCKKLSSRLSQAMPVPGHPRIRTESDIDSFLVRDLCTPELDRISPWLWLISTPSHTNITPLHRQKLRGRDIVVMEDPGLHLLWHRGAIYIKPIPKYLLCENFRQRILTCKTPDIEEGSQVAAAARGYLRTYAHLIRHESDFRLAQSDYLRLVPSDLGWEAFNEFISDFEELDVESVSPRFQTSGELRFSRLTMLVKPLLCKWHYRYTHGTSKEYLENFYAPLLFVFATVSVVLNAMQVTLASDQLRTGQDWRPFWSAARGFALFTMVVTILLMAILVVLLCRGIVSEVAYAINAQMRARLGRKQKPMAQAV